MAKETGIEGPAMQSYLAPSGPSISSAIAFHEDNVGKLAEVDARLSRTVDPPASSRRAAVPKKTLREGLRRPLLILFPVMLVAVGAAYYTPTL
jgi:membrane fusion protein, multidrug efflux system